MIQYKNIILSLAILCFFLNAPSMCGISTAKITYYTGSTCEYSSKYYEYYYLDSTECVAYSCKNQAEGLYSTRTCGVNYPDKNTEVSGFLLHSCIQGCGAENHVEKYATDVCLTVGTVSYKYVCGTTYAHRFSYSDTSCGTQIQNDTYTIGACTGFSYVDCGIKATSTNASNYVSYSSFIIGAIALLFMLF